jgi:molecular chaperone GrpE
VLADFRFWLQHLSSAVAKDQVEETAEPLDFHTLLGQFIALRHEVNLQTKATRSQQEQSGLTLQQLSQAYETLRQAQAAAQQTNQQAQDEALRPLLKTLLDMHDAFSLAEREVRRARETILPLLEELALEASPSENGACEWETEPMKEPAISLEPELDLDVDAGPQPTPAERPKTSLWRRLFARDRDQTSAGVPAVHTEWLARLQDEQQRLRAKLKEQQKAMVAQQEQYERLQSRHQERQRQERTAKQEREKKIKRASERLDQLIDSVITGYGMSLERLERALEHSGLEPIPCVGELFDPERMEVVAAVADSGHPPGEVIEEVRRGYLWRGRIFRYAQVSVAKS